MEISTLIEGLLTRYGAMKEACEALAITIRADESLPVLLPAYQGAPGEEREAAIHSLTQLWHLDPGESLPSAGLICASAQTITAVKACNEAKASFKEYITGEVRKIAGDKTRLDKLIDRVSHSEGARTEKLKQAMKTAGISRLDLLRCYSQIRVLPSPLESISWTWAKTHSSIDPISIPDAIKMAESLPQERTKSIALALLANLHADEKLVLKKKLPNQLRANLVWHESGERLRKAVTISGIVISQDTVLTKYVWRDDPANSGEKTQRLSRVDTTIEAEPYIKALGIHRYIEKPAG